MTRRNESEETSLRLGFGTKAEPIPAIFVGSWERRPRKKQVHGAAVAEVLAPAQECGEVDAVFTRQPGIPIYAVTADCVPVLLANRAGTCVAAVHAGWRGTRARILIELFEKLRAQGEKPEDWRAHVGPAIGPCCYEVSTELAADFAHIFGPGAATPMAPEAILPHPRMLDLPAINAHELRALGLREVEVLRACTRCSRTSAGEFMYESYRRNGSGTRQYSVISL